MRLVIAIGLIVLWPVVAEAWPYPSYCGPYGCGPYAGGYCGPYGCYPPVYPAYYYPSPRVSFDLNINRRGWDGRRWDGLDRDGYDFRFRDRGRYYWR